MFEYKEYVEQQQNKLRESLSDEKVDARRIEDAIAAGYFASGISNGLEAVAPGVMDSYYGNKWSGLIPLPRFAEYLRSGTFPVLPSGVKEYSVRSLSEAATVLASPEHARCAPRMSFRGQTEDHKIRRQVPNPQAREKTNEERMIVPTWWRQWIKKNPAERQSRLDGSIFSHSLFAAPLLFADIPDWREHISHQPLPGWEESGDACQVCEVMVRRSEEHSLRSSVSNELPLLEQHYGFPTIGLDVTFALATAFFFASHQFFQASGEKAVFERIDRGNHKGVVYCFVFESPSVTETNSLVRDLKLFQNVPPLRPLRQRCGLAAFQFNEISAASRDLHAILYLDDSFDISGLPAVRDLFPGREEDMFYGALLRAREEMPEVWHDIVDYA